MSDILTNEWIAERLGRYRQQAPDGLWCFEHGTDGGWVKTQDEQWQYEGEVQPCSHSWHKRAKGPAMTEATDEDVRECNNWLEKLRYRAASEPTGTLRVTVAQLNDIHIEYRKLLARLERVEGELKKATEARVNMNRGENLNRPR